MKSFLFLAHRCQTIYILNITLIMLKLKNSPEYRYWGELENKKQKMNTLKSHNDYIKITNVRGFLSSIQISKYPADVICNNSFESFFTL